MLAMINHPWVMLVSASLLTTLALGFALLAPVGPHSERGVLILVAAAAVTWILWGQAALARVRRVDRASADANLRLILGDAAPPQGNRRTHIR